MPVRGAYERPVVSHPSPADTADFSLLDPSMADDLRKSLEEGLDARAVFSCRGDALDIFRGLVRESIADIENHPRGQLLKRFLKDGPVDGAGPVPPDRAGAFLTDDETASAIAFIYAYMVNAFQGRLAEALAVGPCVRLVRELELSGRLPKGTLLHVADAVSVDQAGRAGRADSRARTCTSWRHQKQARRCSRSAR
jgi:hypothetical protein